jgi:exopolysaccharide biosynthesis polyprenyl glycosylphosphotransferase
MNSSRVAVTSPVEGRATTYAAAPGRRGGWSSVALVGVWDVVLTFVAAWSVLRLPLLPRMLPETSDAAFAAVVVAAAAPIALGVVGAYDLRPGRSVAPSRLALAASLATWSAALLPYAAGETVAVRELAAIWFALPFVWTVERMVLGRRGGRERVLLVGGGEIARRLVELSSRHASPRFRIVGYLEAERPPARQLGVPYLGTPEELPDLLRAGIADRVLVAFPRRDDDEIVDLVLACDRLGVAVDVVPRLFELVGDRVHSYALGSLVLVSADPRRVSWVGEAAKRAVDVAGSLCLLVVFAPLFVLIAAAIVLDDGRPVFFRQTRVGRGRRTFEIVKFRSISPGAGDIALAQVHETLDGGAGIDRTVVMLKTISARDVTRVGRWLRRWSLDELPQLANVLRGEMSLVGPRPLRRFEVDALTERQDVRHQVRPGISGLWQVLGRSEVGWQERLQLDCSYVRHQSFAGDARILVRTLPAVLTGKGAG